MKENPANDDLNFKSPELLLNRETTWLAFNDRVLNEACDLRNPLLERLRFLAIVGNNLDEFFMKRIGKLKTQIANGINRKTPDGKFPKEELQECYQLIRTQEDKQQHTLEVILKELADHKILISKIHELNVDQKIWIREYFSREVFPLITPQSIGPAHPFPFISNKSMNLLVKVKLGGEALGTTSVRIKIPIGDDIKRFVQLPDTYQFVTIEDIVEEHINFLMPDVEILDCATFRVTRNSEIEHDEISAKNLLSLIKSELEDRQFGDIVRVQVPTTMDDSHKHLLAAEMGLDGNEDIFQTIPNMIAISDLMEITQIDLPELLYPVHKQADHPAFENSNNIFQTIRENGPFLLHHPYQNFKTSVEKFLKEAAADDKVKAIKMTLYRTSSDSKVVDYLIQAARNGKQVAVVVELKAKFDEEANIRWAMRMEEAGVHVTYGVVGLKTHSKIILVVRKERSGIKKYLHIGTGNYHAGTAKIYSDFGLLTDDPKMGADAGELFNYLTTGISQNRFYQKLLVAPQGLKKGLIQKIEREIKMHEEFGNGLIQFKMNALEDVDVTQALYKASAAGVKIDLIVRDSCRFRPGLKNISETARVISIIGRFLEHTRIYFFFNNGNEEYLIGSADAMRRNLESRVEVVAPVEDATLQEQLRFVIDTQLNDQRQAWVMQNDGAYIQRTGDENSTGSHEIFMKHYKKSS